MPGYHIQFSSDTSLKMRALLKTEDNVSNIKRIQCIYFIPNPIMSMCTQKGPLIRVKKGPPKIAK